jgi:ribosome-associated protein
VNDRKRQTTDALLRVTRSCAIPLDELEWKFTASGGPGGQHANTSNTKVEVRFDIEQSPSLGPRQRARLLDRIGPVLRVVASERRSQHQNRELALERLRSKLAEGLHVNPTRVASSPSRAAKARRVEQKRHHGDIKRARRRPDPNED